MTTKKREKTSPVQQSRQLSVSDSNNSLKDSPFSEVIYSYTRKQALEDGVLVDLNQFIPIHESGYKYPIACTETVWNIINAAVKNKKYCNDYEGVIWDIIYMSRFKSQAISASTHLYKVIITGVSRQRTFTFKIMVHPGDNMEPVITIMLPEED